MDLFQKVWPVKRGRAVAERQVGRCPALDAAPNSTCIEGLRIAQDLKHACEKDELALVFQPIVELRTGRIVEVEALLRWQHPRFGLLSPDSFIPIAEETGAISEIGEWVIKCACKQLRAWRANLREASELRMSINVSVVQLRDENFVERALATIKREGVAASSLTFEVTESKMMTQPDAMIARIAKLRSAGLRIAVDDFGIGYSSLISVARMPLNTLKIDRDFTRRLGRSLRDDAVTRCMINLGQDLGLQVIAEGVESLDHLSILHSLRCEYAQGYLFSRPLSADCFERLLLQMPCFEDVIKAVYSEREAA
jgi:EAL domain-containing protein (putative c-di-GMP-specific phosphodiesterase class I)